MSWPDPGASRLNLHPTPCPGEIKHTGSSALPRAPGRGVSDPRCWRGAGLGPPWGAAPTWARLCLSEASRRWSRKLRSWASVSARRCRSCVAAGISPFLSRSRPRRARAASDAGARCRTFCRRAPASSKLPVRDWGRTVSVGLGQGGDWEAQFSLSWGWLWEWLADGGAQHQKEGAGSGGAR